MRPSASQDSRAGCSERLMPIQLKVFPAAT